MPQKILGQTYEKLSIQSDLETSEGNLTLNLRKTFDQCSIHSFGSAVLDPQITRYNIRTSAFYPQPHAQDTGQWPPTESWHILEPVHGWRIRNLLYYYKLLLYWNWYDNC